MATEEITDVMKPKPANRKRFRVAVCATATIVALLAACGSDDDQEARAEATPTVEAAQQESEPEPTATPAPTPEPTPGSAEADEEMDDEPVVWVSTTSAKFGGFAFDHPEDWTVLESIRDYTVFVVAPNDIPPQVPGARPVVGFFQVNQTFAGQPLNSVADVVEAIEVAVGGTVTMGEEPIDAFGLELVQYHVTGAEERPLFSSRPFGYAGDSFWTPTGASDLYMAEVDGFVHGIWTSGRGPDMLAEMNAVMRDIVATLEVTSPDGTIKPLPVPVEGVEVDLGPAPDIEAAQPLDNGVRVLESSFQPVPRRVQFTMFGVPIEFDVPEDVVIPDADTSDLLAIGDVLGRGPYELGLWGTPVVSGLAPLGPGEVPIAQPYPIGSIPDLIADPPPNLVFSNVDLEASIGGVPGYVFDLAIDDSTTCGGVELPCNYGFLAPLPENIVVFGDGHVNRVWVIPEIENGAYVFMASGRPAEVDPWLEKMDAMFAGMTITR